MKITVLLITYNHERFIRQALDSVLAQVTDFDFEIVIHDDCSTDGTREILMRYAEVHPLKIRLLLSPVNLNSNLVVERGLSAASGEYIAFLEGDDYWTSPHKLQKQVDFLDTRPDQSMCCSRVRYFHEPIAETGGIWGDVWPNYPAGSYAIEDVLKNNFVATCSAVLKRHLIAPLPEWYFTMYPADWPLWAMAARHGKIELMDEIMAVYRMHPASAWSSQRYAIRVRQTARMLRALDKGLGYRYTGIIRENIAQHYLELARRSRSKGRRIETAKHVVSYILSGGWRLPGGVRAIAGMILYEVTGAWYKVFSA